MTKIVTDHGSGGLATRHLIENLFLKRLSNPILHRLEDSAVMQLEGSRIAFTTDSFVIDPVFFPGGDIGALSVHGTVNDLAMQGARPMFLSLALILEEGLPLELLDKIASSIANAAKEADVAIVAADTKVVGKGQADKLFINTSGIGIMPDGVQIGADRACTGDKVIVSGFIGDHGAAVMLARSGLPFHAEIKSDSAPLNNLTGKIISFSGKSGIIRSMRDPTRGGVATVLNETAQASNVVIEINEECLPIRAEVQGVCDLLGLDPLYLANEGKCVVIVAHEMASELIEIMKTDKHGKNSAIIGEVKEAHADQQPHVRMKTRIGGSRIVPMLSGEPLPRIC